MKRFYLILLFFSNFGLYAAGAADNILGASSESYEDVGSYCGQCGQYYQNSADEHALSCGRVEEDLVDLLDDAEDDVESLEEDAESFFCTEAGCASAFPSFEALEDHIFQDHNGGLQHCDMCDYKTKSKHNLIVHQRIHTGEKPYECDMCDQAFAARSNLKSHKRVHTGEKPYECDMCDKVFGVKNHLKEHKKTHTGEKPYTCSECGMDFRHSTALERHQRIHTGEKPYKCDYPSCFGQFRQYGNLAAHKRIHTGEKPYPCRWCGKPFRISAHRNKHEKSHCCR